MCLNSFANKDMSFKILNTIGEVFTDSAKDILSSVGEVDYKTLTQNELDAIIGDYDALLVGLGVNFHKGTLEKAPKLKVIATATTGLNHIAVDYAKEKGIEILSLRGENEFLDSITSTGELAFSLMLDLMRFNPWAFEDVKNYRWERENFRGWSLYGKTIGIVGMGRLGKIVAAGAAGFRMKVLFTDPNVSQEQFPQYKKVSFDELLSESDVVSIHVHLSPETEKMFNEGVLKKMKKSAYLINTARGEIVDEDAIQAALQSGELAGYGTDVLSGELSFGSIFDNYPLVEYAKKNRNCIILPHTGGMTHDSRIATDVFMAKKLQTFLSSHG